MPELSYVIPASLEGEISELEKLINDFKNNVISETELKARRVPFGVYEQRKKGTYMVRARCAAGIITPSQLRRVAELSLRLASGLLHVTTRQEIQVHDVALDDLISIIRQLARAGLSTRGGGGNTVRNITAPWDSGVACGETFDVAPYATALTSAMTARGDSWLLPRKYKIGFSNSPRADIFPLVSDLGFIARTKDGVRGFKVFVAGGLGRHSQPGNLLHDFVPASDMLLIAEAIKRLFSKFGNRKNKHAARLRFLWNTLGHEQFIDLYHEERNRLAGEHIESPPVRDIAQEAIAPAALQPVRDTSAEFELWKKRYVGAQKQPGAHTVRLPLLFGIVPAQKAKELADFLEPFGDNTIRFTHDQNIALRNIPSDYLGNVYRVARKISELTNTSPIFGNAVVCAGASTCQLGICRSRGALEAIIDRLKISSANLDDCSDLRIHISGCSNTCGQHMVADLGFFGKVGRKDQHSYPAYSIVAGATFDVDGKFRLAEKIDEISARNLPVLVEEIAQRYSSRKTVYSDYNPFLNAEGRDLIHEICDRFRDLPSFDADKSYYRDWGDTELFSLAGKSSGECSAGLFDLIEIDLARIRQLRGTFLENEGKPSSDLTYDLALFSARMLLITRGVEAASDKEVFKLFIELFLHERLIDSRFLPVLEKGKTGDKEALVSMVEEIIALSNAVEHLYQGMDNSLQFKTREIEKAAKLPEQNNADCIKDFRGVACPMNFVKTKMALSGLKPGQTLEILLDDGAPIDNVPKSVAEEGHAVLSADRIGDHWRVRIRKK